MQCNRQQFDLAIGGASATAIVAATFVSFRFAIPVAVVGGLVTGIVYALRDAGERDREGGASGDR
jgi:thiamine transporter ThiT